MRDLCLQCFKAKVVCYCAALRPFETGPRFVILIHPVEWRNTVGTGRMTHLSISNSLFLRGHDFSEDERVNAILQDPRYHSAVLYPGRQALNLSTCSTEEAQSFTPAGKQLVIFVIDGTWDLARGMINRSANLKALPQICFTPEQRSIYEIREQPQDYCLSTLEAVHWMIDRFDQLGAFAAPAERAHDHLIQLFSQMIQQQIAYAAGRPGRTVGARTAEPSPLSK